MSFIWPKALVLLLATPLLVAAYLNLVRRRADRAAALAAQGFVPTASARRLRRVRHLPFAFFLIALVLLLFALSRPAVSLGIPHREGTVILAFDVSNSMRATDLKPTRIDAAKTAARAFVEKQPDTIKVGVVAFSNGALLTQQPTNNHAQVLASIDRLTPMGGTSLGQGIFASLSAIAGKPLSLPKNASVDDIENLNVGYYGSGEIVLLSDGENTSQPDPLAVAKLASTAGVHIYTIGLGTTAGTVVQINGFSVATALDEDLLTNIAQVTNGKYFNAPDEASLADIYKNIKLKETTDPLKTEITGALSGAAIGFLIIGGALSLVWFGRLV
jgi:Ca-activated chloride channel family protein